MSLFDPIIDDLYGQARTDLSIMRQPPPLDEFLKRHFKNYSKYLYTILYLLKLYFNNNNNRSGSREEEQFLKWSFKNCWGSQSSQVIKIIMDRKAVTSREVEQETGVSAQLVKHVMDKMGWFKLLETSKTVSAGYVNQPGRPPAIFQTPEATSKDIHEAEKRYAVIMLGFDPEERQRELVERREAAEREKIEEAKRQREEARQRLIQQHEPLIQELIEDNRDLLVKEDGYRDAAHRYYDRDWKTIKETKNPRPQGWGLFTELLREAERRVKQEPEPQ